MRGVARVGRLASELRRRKVWRVAAAYLSVGIAVVLAIAELYDDMGLPGWTTRFVLVLVAVGLPIALVLAWAYEVRPDEAESGSAAGPTSSVSLDAVSTDPASSARDAASRASAEASERSVVVLPFENMSPDAADAYLADGLAEEITADLAGIRALRVISRTSAFQYRGTAKGTRTIARELSVRYILEAASGRLAMIFGLPRSSSTRAAMRTCGRRSTRGRCRRSSNCRSASHARLSRRSRYA